jgi:hypothetical protein
MNKQEYENWLRNFRADVREACKAFPTQADWPQAWLLLDGEEPDEWYDCEELLGLPVYRTRAYLTHSGHDGEQQPVIPLWLGDVSSVKYYDMRREFEARLAKSGDF